MGRLVSQVGCRDQQIGAELTLKRQIPLLGVRTMIVGVLEDVCTEVQKADVLREERWYWIRIPERTRRTRLIVSPRVGQATFGLVPGQRVAPWRIQRNVLRGPEICGSIEDSVSTPNGFFSFSARIPHQSDSGRKQFVLGCRRGEAVPACVAGNRDARRRIDEGGARLHLRIKLGTVEPHGKAILAVRRYVGIPAQPEIELKPRRKLPVVLNERSRRVPDISTDLTAALPDRE